MKTIFKRRKPAGRREALICDLNETKSRIEAAEGAFSFATDPDMIESAVLELGALGARYGKILREIRELRDADEAV